MADEKKYRTFGLILLKSLISGDKHIRGLIDEFINTVEKDKNKRLEVSKGVYVVDGGVIAGHFDFYILCYSKDVELLEDFILNFRMENSKAISDSQTIVGVTFSEGI